jgi:hypothetical protein
VVLDVVFLEEKRMNDPLPNASLLLQVNAGLDASQEEQDELARQLLTELEDLDVQAGLYHPDGALPPGAKASEATLFGSLAVSVLPAFLPKLVEFLQNWMQRGDRRIVKIKTQIGDRSLELEYSPATMTNQDLKKLVTLLNTSLEKKS